MFLSELCPSLTRRLAGCSSLLHRVGGSLSRATSQFSSAPLSLTTDDADEPRELSDPRGLPGVVYVELIRSRRKYVERFLHRELGLDWARAQREMVRCSHLVSAGVPLMTENLAFFTERGVLQHHLQEDVDLLAVGYGDLMRVYDLVTELPDAEYCHYYPLSRARPDTITELFRRLATRRSNMVHQLADILRLPELTVSRAVSRMSTQITKSSNDKLLSNAKLLIDLGVPPAELGRSMYLLRLSGTRLRHRLQQCKKHGIPLHGRYLGMSDNHFERRLSRGGRLAEGTADVTAVVADRLGVTPDQVAEQTRRSDVLQSLTSARLETVTTILERAGYSPAERLSALITLYRSRPAKIQQRLELCGQLGRPKPSLALLAMDQRRFERRVVRWRREASLEEGTADEVRTDLAACSDFTGEGESLASDSDGREGGGLVGNCEEKATVDNPVTANDGEVDHSYPAEEDIKGLEGNVLLKDSVKSEGTEG